MSSIFEKRLKNLRELLKQKSIDAAFIAKRENYIYLSGFTGSSAYLIITQNEAMLITDFRYVEQAGMQAPDYKVIQYQGSFTASLNDMLSDMDINTLGFEETSMSYSSYNEYRSKLNIKELVPLEGAIEKLRVIKDDKEIALMQKAAEIADATFSHILSYVKPGVSELEIAAEMEYHMKKLGAKGQSFEIIVASGKRASMPHGVASEKKIEMGDVITLDFGAIYNEYCSDMTRTVFLGKPKDEIKKIYNIVLDAQVKALEGSVKGLSGKEIDLIARNAISEAGYGKNFGHGLGHGVGIEIHEEPRLSPAGSTKMENGMVVTVEPGIYVPELGGVRIEDMIMINEDKPYIFTKSAKELIIL